MTFDYPQLVMNLSEEERIRFYELLANNLTVNVRGIWSDDSLSDAQKVECMRWLNEIMHGVVQKSAALRSRRHSYSEEESWESINHCVSQSPAIDGSVEWAIKASYERCFL
jgi:hypothetical protein